MKNVLTLLYMGVLVSGIFAIHIAGNYLIPAPFNYVNVILIFLAWVTFRQNSNQPVWFALVFGFLIELFSADHFGISMAAMVVSVVILNWLLRTVFTNYSWYMILCTSFLFIVTYQVGLIVLRIMADIVLRQPLYFTSAVITEIAIEAVANAIILAFIYLVATGASKRYSPRYI